MRLKMDLRVRGILCSALLILAVGCSPKKAGDYRQDCYPNDTCNTGLACVGGTCVRAEDDNAAPSSEAPAAEANPTPAGSVDEASGASSDVNEAFAAYRRHYDAWNRFDEQAYFANYLPSLDCYYNEANYASSRLKTGSRGRHFSERQPMRLAIDSLEFVSQEPDEVVFMDHGTYTENGSTRDHEKLIVMKRVDGEWRISVEASRSAHGCFERNIPEPTERSRAQGVPCAEYLACFESCDNRFGSSPDHDAHPDCYGDCYRKFNYVTRSCVPTYDARTRPCDADRECRAVCRTLCNGQSCNSEMLCFDDCEEKFASSCPESYPAY